MQILWSLSGFFRVTGWLRLPVRRRFLRSKWEGIRRNLVVPARMAVVALGGSIAVSLVGAASPQEPAPQPEKPAEQVYKNIQAFKGLPNSRLFSAMFFMEGSLQVNCGHCHDWEDFSKDDKPAKRTARKMILMVEQLNETQFEGKQLISCNTCHRGQSPPAASLPFAKVEQAAPGRPGSKDTSTALPSAPELFAREVQAAGGEHAMDNIHSRVMHGTRFSSEGWSSPVEIYQQAPDKWRDSLQAESRVRKRF
jgi:Photosynthetic reaction centre cytochrome C subunit